MKNILAKSFFYPPHAWELNFAEVDCGGGGLMISMDVSWQRSSEFDFCHQQTFSLELDILISCAVSAL